MKARLISQGVNLDLDLDPNAARLVLPAPGEFLGFTSPDLALDNPSQYPFLEECVTPDDRVVISGDSASLALPGTIDAVLDRLKRGKISIENITLVLGKGSYDNVAELIREKGYGISIVHHDPENSSDSCYLATLRNGKRVYLNRALLESDFQVFVGSPSRGADGLLVGPEVPILSGLMMPHSSGEIFNSDELEEVGTLLGNPYFLVTVDSGGDDPGKRSWWAGGWESAREARRAHRFFWRARAQSESRVVVVGTGLSGGATFPEWCQVMKKAWRIVADQGLIILVAGNSRPDISKWLPFFEKAGEPGDLLEKIRGIPREFRCLGWWARAAEKAQIHVLSGLGEDEISGIFAQPIGSDQIRSAVASADSVAIIGDFSKAIVGVPVV